VGFSRGCDASASGFNLTLLRQLRAEGHTLAAVASDLNQRGIRTRTDGPWSH
jgi:Recombinase